VTTVPHFSGAARRARLVHRHHLGAADAFVAAYGSRAAPATGAPAAPGLSSEAGDPIADLVRDLVVLHATDAASVFLQVAARLPGVTVADVEDALYERRSLVRMLGMRRTVYVVTAGLAGVVQISSADRIAATERRKLLKNLVHCGVHDDTPAAEAWLERIEEKILAALEVQGRATASQLATEVPELRVRLHFNTGKAYDTPQNITSRVLGNLAASGRIVRGRPRGSWRSTQYEWATTSTWLGIDEWAGDPREARVALARAWLSRYGPGTVADLTWWTGWTGGQVREALAGLDTVPVDLDGVPGLVLAGDEEPVPAAPGPFVALLPALDPTVMGWAGRDWYLGAHGPRLFDRTGNAGPTVWVDGRVAGGWAQRPGGSVAVRLLEDVGREAAALAEDLAVRLSAWLGPVRVTPKFRTPLERELAAS